MGRYIDGSSKLPACNTRMLGSRSNLSVTWLPQVGARYGLGIDGMSLMLILLGVPAWARGRLLDSQLALWAVAYALPYLLADAYFRRWLRHACAAAPVTRASARGSD